jgi:hypothetical protein
MYDSYSLDAFALHLSVGNYPFVMCIHGRKIMSHQKQKGNKEIKKPKKNLRLKTRKQIQRDMKVGEPIRSLFEA